MHIINIYIVLFERSAKESCVVVEYFIPRIISVSIRTIPLNSLGVYLGWLGLFH